MSLNEHAPLPCSDGRCICCEGSPAVRLRIPHLADIGEHLRIAHRPGANSVTIRRGEAHAHGGNNAPTGFFAGLQPEQRSVRRNRILWNGLLAEGGAECAP